MKSRTAKSCRSGSDVQLAKRWQLRLYVHGRTPKSRAAFANLKQLCENQLRGRYRIEEIDLLNPNLVKGDQILAIPTLLRKLPQAMRKIIGDLFDVEQVLVGWDLQVAH